VASGRGPRAELISVSAPAAQRGVQRGNRVAHARTLCGELAVCVTSPALERAAHRALLDAALSCSPRATLAPPASGALAGEAAVHLDASGITAIFYSEPGFAAALGARARHLGLPAAVAIASSRSVARIAARLAASLTEHQPGEETRVRIVAPGAEAAFLAPLPLDVLDPEDALGEALTRFGVRSVRDLLALPPRALATRLGPRVLEWLALLRGEAVEHPLPSVREHRLVEAIDLEHPVDRAQPLLFVLQGLLSRLLARLEARRLGCGDLALQLDLTSGARDARHIGVAAPTRDLRVLVRLATCALEARVLEAPVQAVALETEGRPLRSDQLDLFRPAGPAPLALGQTLAELASLCGPERVGAPASADTHHPDAFATIPFAPPSAAPTQEGVRPPQAQRTRSERKPEGRAASQRRAESNRMPSEVEQQARRARSEAQPSEVEQQARRARSEAQPSEVDQQARRARSEAQPSEVDQTRHFTASLALRVLRPPVRARVHVRRHRPDWIRSAVANGRVIRLAGPWRTTGGWWSREDRFAFDSFDVQTSDGTVARLRLDHVRREWQIDAVYD
jgi:protein ImuB